jgi:hypothetical protein
VTVNTAKRMVSVPAPDEVRDLAEVTEVVRASGIAVDELALRRPTLDDAFLALTGQPVEPALSDDQKALVAS